MNSIKKKKYLLLFVLILCIPSHVFSYNLMDLIHAALDRDKGFKTTFTRGGGYWSKPEDEKNEGYFSRLAEEETQREDWYKVSPYISEFWCSISNLPLVYVGLKHQSPEVIFGGLASFAYHSCPKQWLLHVDRIGVGLVFLKFAKEYKIWGWHR